MLASALHCIFVHGLCWRGYACSLKEALCPRINYLRLSASNDIICNFSFPFCVFIRDSYSVPWLTNLGKFRNRILYRYTSLLHVSNASLVCFQTPMNYIYYISTILMA